MVVDLTSRSEVPVAFWRLEMRGDDGNLIKTAEGRELPAKVDVTMPDQTVECILTAMDILGNQLRREIKDLTVFASQEKTRDIRRDKWLMEF